MEIPSANRASCTNYCYLKKRSFSLLAMKNEKAKKVKSIEQRHLEIDNALMQLSALGLTSEMDGVAKFLTIVEDYFDKGIHASGDIVIEGTKRRIVYKLSMQPHIASSIVLKHDEHA